MLLFSSDLNADAVVVILHSVAAQCQLAPRRAARDSAMWSILDCGMHPSSDMTQHHPDFPP